MQDIKFRQMIMYFFLIVDHLDLDCKVCINKNVFSFDHDVKVMANAFL
jgi:hypothetical protein